MIDQKWLIDCATAGEFLYGHYTVAALKKMYERKKGCSASADELIEAMKGFEESGTVLMSYLPGRLYDSDPDELGFFVPAECEGTELEKVMKQADAAGNPYASLHFDDDERVNLMAEVPDDLEFYIPSHKEIEELIGDGYIRTPAMDKLEKEILTMGGDPSFLQKLWPQISTDKMDQMEAISAILTGMSKKSEKAQYDEALLPATAEGDSLDDLNARILLINDFINNVNLRSRKGWRPHDLFRKMYPDGITSMPTIEPGSVHAAKMLKQIEPRLRAMGANVSYRSIDSYAAVGAYGERKVVKVGRNDPCPCGSGLKYKKCHGKWK